MTYFIVLPFVIVWLIAAGAGVIAARVVPQFEAASPYVWRIALWATIDLVAANTALLLLLWLVSAGSATSDTSSSGAGRLLLALGIFAGPVIASGLGWLGGAMMGFFLAFRRVH